MIGERVKIPIYVAEVEKFGKKASAVVFATPDEVLVMESPVDGGLEEGLREALRMKEAFSKVVEGEWVITVSPGDYERAKKILPAEKIETCSYNPAYSVAAERCLGER
ncbi:hypothetical protein Theam_1817 (plasmid) [Thermovibrio ammonificans HB-1]|uniref:Uncharacterized protein n=1 Tax=Thermovibrio ammonificans (strain DSM 15698 / JCM 12110 / HB-1) TaxID=648996 RepID=E8T6V0_THEA1|nr:hypothetical protein [Thermovibrio ammonificans]ADU97773.1 hypothetical protein Theam_1817 [Thermovibrio ammonificans HB-1]